MLPFLCSDRIFLLIYLFIFTADALELGNSWLIFYFHFALSVAHWVPKGPEGLCALGQWWLSTWGKQGSGYCPPALSFGDPHTGFGAGTLFLGFW